tara:strand:- start:903 stop:1028 length:126 start_codon:yes stop_codon:yes gene_type:complete
VELVQKVENFVNMLSQIIINVTDTGVVDTIAVVDMVTKKSS